jgi:predicted transcriptional regulator
VAEVRRAREVLEAEREAVRRAIRKNGAAKRRLDKRRSVLWEKQRELDMDAAVLLVRGKEAGLSVTEMAEALGATRQWAHKQIREYPEMRVDLAFRGRLPEDELTDEERARLERIRATRAKALADQERALVEPENAEEAREGERDA